MIPFSATCVRDRYLFLLPHDYLRVVYRNAYITDMYNRLKMLGCRLFDALYLAKHISEKKIGTVDSSFKAIEEIVERSDAYYKPELPSHPFDKSSSHVESVNLLAGHIQKMVADVPGRQFIKMTEERQQLKKEEVEVMLTSAFDIPRNFFLIKEITATELILANLSLEEIRLLFKREIDDYRRANLGRKLNILHHLNQVGDKIFASIFYMALNNLSQRLYKLIRDFQSLFKETSRVVKERGLETNIIKPTYMPSWKVYPEWYLLLRFPRAKEFNMGSQIPIMGTKTIKPFQKAMDRLFQRDKVKRITGTEVLPAEIIKPLQDYSSENVKKPVVIDLDHIRNLIKAEAAASLQPAGNQNTKNKSEKPKQPVETTPPASKRQVFLREFKEIIGYGNTMHGLQICFEKRIRSNLSENSEIPTLLDASVKGKDVTHKIRRLLAKVKTRGLEQKSEESKEELNRSMSEELNIVDSQPPSRLRSGARVIRSQIAAVKPPSREFHVPRSANSVTRSKVLGALNLPPDTRIKKMKGSNNTSFQITAGNSRFRSQSARGRPYVGIEERSASVTKEDSAKMRANIDHFILSPF